MAVKTSGLKAPGSIFEELRSERLLLRPYRLEDAPALYEAQCPMAQASWLQTSKDLANPYMGQAMLKCGMVTQSIKAPDEKKE